MISSLMIVTSLAMLAFPKQLRGNRIPAPHQIESIDAHKPAPKTEQPEEDTAPQLKGIFVHNFVGFSSHFDAIVLMIRKHFNYFYRFPEDNSTPFEK